jgi:predicted lipoprotein
VIQGFADQPQRATYLQNVAELIIATAAEVYAAWSPDGGNYLGEFTSDGALGADAGSSLGKLVNALNLSFERNTRDAKIGIPAGIRSLGITIPEATEAYYAGYSLELALANVDAYKKLFLGQTREGVKGLGFDDYLKARKAATTSGSELPLDEAINAQFDAVLGFIDQIENPLDEQIRTDNSRVQQVFAQMQQLAVLLKTDMASALGVVISYQDNDGD